MGTDGCSTCPLRGLDGIDDFERKRSRLNASPTSHSGKKYGYGVLKMALQSVSTALLKIWPNGQAWTNVVPVGAQGFILRHAGLSCGPAQAYACVRARAQVRVRRG